MRSIENVIGHVIGHPSVRPFTVLLLKQIAEMTRSKSERPNSTSDIRLPGYSVPYDKTDDQRPYVKDWIRTRVEKEFLMSASGIRGRNL